MRSWAARILAVDMELAGVRVSRQRQREAIADAIAPIWEANHVWSFSLSFCCSPDSREVRHHDDGAQHSDDGDAAGHRAARSAFVFRKYDVKDERRWSTVFGMASFLTPFFQGSSLAL